MNIRIVLYAVSTIASAYWVYKDIKREYLKNKELDKAWALSNV